MLEKAALLEKVKGCGWWKEDIGHGLKASVLESAFIQFSKPIRDFSSIAKSRRFSYVCNLEHEGKWFGATAVDTKNGAVFGVSCSSEGIILVPKHRMGNNISLVDYYLMVIEKIDSQAMLMKMSEHYAEDQELKDYYCHGERPRRYPWDDPE